MSFEMDNDAFKDLEIFNLRSDAKSIFSIIDRTKTGGGKSTLSKIMREPSSNYESLTNRRDVIKFFYQKGLEIDVNYHQLDMIEHYLSFNKRCLRNTPLDAIWDYYYYKIKPTNDYYIIISGLNAIIKLIRTSINLVDSIKTEGCPEYLYQKISIVDKVIENKEILNVLASAGKLKCFEINKLDNFFRGIGVNAIKDLIQFIYEVDVFASLAVLKREGWCLPEYDKDCLNKIQIEGLINPFIELSIENDLAIDFQTKLLFITGSNMTGKSSFLKATGIAVYLAHLGFPVPAISIKTSIFKGLLTSINLTDNIHDGLSHYYLEVKRAKKVALKLLECGSLFVIFDEIFKGTNIKDAYEATFEVVNKLSKINNSKFLVSSHLSELSTDLSGISGVAFYYFDFIFKNGEPQFVYKLKRGVSNERLGMYFIRKEDVLSILEKASHK